MGAKKSSGGRVRRDLKDALESTIDPDLVAGFTVEWELLKKIPMRSDDGFPTMYIWCRASKDGKLLQEGPAKLMVAEKRYKFTHVFIKKEIVDDPTCIERVFLDVLHPVIRAKAGVAK